MVEMPISLSRLCFVMASPHDKQAAQLCIICGSSAPYQWNRVEYLLNHQDIIRLWWYEI